MIILDENVEQFWIDLIRNEGFEYISIREQFQGITDLEVIEIVKKQEGILVTEDKDFGELVFAYGIKSISILFLRYDQPQYDQIKDHFIEIINRYKDGNTIGFVTITKNKIRMRSI
jgi:predicted nuclease of predicted toxin-antitoxin system